MSSRLTDRCYEVLGDIARFERELDDVRDALQAYKARVIEILDERAWADDPDDTFREIRSFLASR